jgi:hypothetical protein
MGTQFSTHDRKKRPHLRLRHEAVIGKLPSNPALGQI